MLATGLKQRKSSISELVQRKDSIWSALASAAPDGSAPRFGSLISSTRTPGSDTELQAQSARIEPIRYAGLLEGGRVGNTRGP